MSNPIYPLFANKNVRRFIYSIAIVLASYAILHLIQVTYLWIVDHGVGDLHNAYEKRLKLNDISSPNPEYDPQKPGSTIIVAIGKASGCVWSTFEPLWRDCMTVAVVAYGVPFPEDVYEKTQRVLTRPCSLELECETAILRPHKLTLRQIEKPKPSWEASKLPYTRFVEKTYFCKGGICQPQ